MNSFEFALPIDEALPALTAALREREAAVLVAPPGAGKTTRVPLVLADEAWAKNRKILVLEPRRIAARAAAARMAATLGEEVGETVGYRVRFGSKVSRSTRIEVVTEGVFTRMVLDNASLDGVAALLFDEFHERSLDADLGLALARDIQQGLREDLKLLVMSATIDGARVAKLLGDAPVIESHGRAFPVETRYLGRDPRVRIESEVAQAVLRALRTEAGSVLAFLPGAAEIRRTETLLRERISDPAVDVVALFGALEAEVQDRAIAPAPAGRRKIVLSTAIAETSLTIEGVRIVVDSGLARVPRYEADVGLTRLETVRVSRASADQRRGRAGRTEPAVCYRLWDEPQTASLAAANTPEILAADLSGLILDLASWGVADPARLAFLDPPPRAALAEAKALLALPLPPRLARMVIDGAAAGAGRLAAEIALILSEHGLGGSDVDLAHRLDVLRRDRSPRASDARAMARRWAESASVSTREQDVAGVKTSAATFPPPLRGRDREGGRNRYRTRGHPPPHPSPSRSRVYPTSTTQYLGEPRQAGVRMGEGAERLRGDSEASTERAGFSPGALLALAYPDRIAKSRGAGGAFLLASGRGANVDPASPLAREPFLAVAEIAGTAAQGRILLAAKLTLDEIEAQFGDRIETRDEITFDAASASLRGRKLRRLGAVTLAEQPVA